MWASACANVPRVSNAIHRARASAQRSRLKRLRVWRHALQIKSLTDIGIIAQESRKLVHDALICVKFQTLGTLKLSLDSKAPGSLHQIARPIPTHLRNCIPPDCGLASRPPPDDTPLPNRPRDAGGTAGTPPVLLPTLRNRSAGAVRGCCFGDAANAVSHVRAPDRADPHP